MPINKTIVEGINSPIKPLKAIAHETEHFKNQLLETQNALIKTLLNQQELYKRLNEQENEIEELRASVKRMEKYKVDQVLRKVM